MSKKAKKVDVEGSWRKLAPNEDAVKAINFIRENKLSGDQVKYRYTVKQIDCMCAEMGLYPKEKESEDSKVLRLQTVIHAPVLHLAVVERPSESSVNASHDFMEQFEKQAREEEERLAEIEEAKLAKTVVEDANGVESEIA